MSSSRGGVSDSCQSYYQTCACRRMVQPGITTFGCQVAQAQRKKKKALGVTTDKEDGHELCLCCSNSRDTTGNEGNDTHQRSPDWT